MATLLRLPAVVERTGLSRASVYLHVNKGTMTRPIKIGERSVAWDSAEIDAINAARIAGKRAVQRSTVGIADAVSAGYY